VKIFLSLLLILSYENSSGAGLDVTPIDGPNINLSAISNTTNAASTVAPNGSFFDKAKEACTSNPVMCGMAVLTGYQIISTLIGSKDSKKVADQTQCTGSFCTNGTANGDNVAPNNFGNNPAGDGLSPGDRAVLNKTQNGLKALAKDGYTYDAAKNAVNTPNGSVPASSYASTDGLKKLGATDADIKSIEQNIRNSHDGYGSFGYDDGGGGGAKPKAKGYEDKPLDMNAYMKSLMGQDKSRDVAGLQKRMGSDSIGVAQDDIFQMIHRSYKNQESNLSP
jgi:hypothetical protein